MLTFVMPFMNKDGLNSLLSDEITLGGDGVTAKEVLKENKVIAPVAVRAFTIMLGRYSSRRVVE